MQDDFADELTQAFIQESREFIESIEPGIIELEQNCQDVRCWEIMKCDNAACPRHKKTMSIPCWLHTGFIEHGSGVCSFSKSKQDCLSCQVFQMTNGENEKVNAIFRPFHSIKGTAGFLGLKSITHVTHTAETMLDLIRSGGIKFCKGHITLLCQAIDFLKEALDHLENCSDDNALESWSKDMSSTLQRAIDEAKAMCSADAVSAALNEQDGTPDETPEDFPANALPDFTMEITPEMVTGFIQEADELLQQMEKDLLNWLKSPDDMEIVADLFRTTHSFKGNCGFLNFGDMEKLSQEMESLLEAAKSGASINKNRATELLLKLKDVLREAVVDISEEGKGSIADLDNHIEEIQDILSEQGENLQEPGKPALLGEILIKDGAVSKNEVASALAEQKKPLGEILIDKGAATPQQVEKALQKQEAEKPKETSERRKVKRQDIRVDLDKLDHLINMIGELVIAENMLVNNPDLEGLELEHFGKASQHMNKIVRDLQEVAMVIRMVPVAGLFRRMIRLVHDLSKKFNKKVDFQLKGEETEIDKTVIEFISDPLVHIIRNSLDHGLESQEEREKAGKPPVGSIILSASHEEGEILITIEDDGKGLNKEKILTKAISRGLIEGDGSNLSDDKIYGLIFLPGFSTADKITDVSGRGVGMDVVKQNVEKINGKIEVKSRPGHGTKLILHIPLTMAIIEGMMVRVGNCSYILPIMSIRQNFCPTEDSITITPEGQELAKVYGNFIPIVRLHKLYGVTPDHEKLHEGVLIIIEARGGTLCLFVDEILGQQQAVIKGLSKYIGAVKGISGCTILGNGEICLILDATSLIEEFSNDRKEQMMNS
ncbi:MAG: chemotaxis protein CheA [bacterium]